MISTSAKTPAHRRTPLPIYYPVNTGCRPRRWHDGGTARGQRAALRPRAVPPSDRNPEFSACPVIPVLAASPAAQTITWQSRTKPVCELALNCDSEASQFESNATFSLEISTKIKVCVLCAHLLCFPAAIHKFIFDEDILSSNPWQYLSLRLGTGLRFRGISVWIQLRHYFSFTGWYIHDDQHLWLSLCFTAINKLTFKKDIFDVISDTPMMKYRLIIPDYCTI